MSHLWSVYVSSSSTCHRSKSSSDLLGSQYHEDWKFPHVCYGHAYMDRKATVKVQTEFSADEEVYWSIPCVTFDLEESILSTFIICMTLNRLFISSGSPEHERATAPTNVNPG